MQLFMWQISVTCMGLAVRHVGLVHAVPQCLTARVLNRRAWQISIQESLLPLAHAYDTL